MNNHRLVICGYSGTTHLGDSLRRASIELGLANSFCDANLASSRWRLVNSLSWRTCDKRQPHPGRVAAALISEVLNDPNCCVITTGNVAVEAKVVEECCRLGALMMHFSSDDPWNPAHKTKWLLEALPHYDVVFTPRTANIEEFIMLGCSDVRYLPFGYDADLFGRASTSSDSSIDCLFVGGADSDRRSFFSKFEVPEAKVALVGRYWSTYPETRLYSLGQRSPEEVRDLTLSAKVNLILVRRANRDGHTMRSFEAGAIGGCLVVEDTPDHRMIFGPDGEAVRYFKSVGEAADLCRRLIADLPERERLSSAVRQRILAGGHSYADRLMTMISSARDIRSRLASGGECA